MAGNTSERARQASILNRPRERSRVLALAGLAALNVAVYAWFLVRPWHLLALYRRPLLDLQQLSVEDPMARWRLLAGFVLLGGFYLLGWNIARRARSRAAWIVVLTGTALSGTILLFLYPFDAADLFDNILHGRILAVHSANPFEQVPADFAGDPFYPYVGWRRFPSAYGPGWELVAAATARLAGDGILTNVFAFKTLGGLFLSGCLALIASLLRRMAPERALGGVLLLAWNPLVLYETLGHGHNDVAMLFWILAATVCLARGRRTLAVLALVAGALFKFLPLLLLPAAGLISLGTLPTAKARLRFAAVTACAATLLIVVAYAPFWHGAETLGIGRRSGLFTASLPALARAWLEVPWGRGCASLVVSVVAAVLTAAFALWQGVRASRQPSWQSFVLAAFSVLMFYLLVTCLWFQQWYMIWPLGLVPLLPVGYLAWSGVFIGFAVLSKPLIFEPLWLWTHPFPDRAWLEVRLGPAIMALPWLGALAALWLERRLPSGQRDCAC